MTARITSPSKLDALEMGQKVERWSRASTRRASKPFRETLLSHVSALSHTLSPSGAVRRKGAQTPKWSHSALPLSALKQLESDKPSDGKIIIYLLCYSVMTFRAIENILFSPSSKRQTKDLCRCFPTGT